MSSTNFATRKECAEYCLTELDLSVFPVSRGAKRPLIEWQTYSSRLPSEDEVSFWWGRWPKCDTGIATGQVSGIVVVDADTPEAITYIQEQGWYTEVQVETPRGRHYWFRAPKGVELASTAKMFGVAGLDFRGDGGYVKAPPSDGYSYVGGFPYDLGFALPDCPEAIVNNRRRGQVSEIADTDNLASLSFEEIIARLDLSNVGLDDGREETPEVVQEGEGRNVALAREVGRAIKELGLWGDALLTWARGFSLERFHPPLDDTELTRTVLSIMQAHARNHGEIQSAKEVAEEVGSGESRRARFSFAPVGDLLKTPEQAKWLLRGYLQPDSLSMLFGDPGAGKSLLALDWAACIATGREWHGQPVRQGAVIYLAGEGHFGIRRRFKAWAIHNNCEAELADSPLFVSEYGAALTKMTSVKAVVEAVDEIAETHRPELIVIDTLHRNFGPGDENNAEDISRFLRTMDGLKRRYQCAVMVVHHSGHGDKLRARGSSSIKGAMDTEICLESNQEGQRLLSCTKQKDASPFADSGLELKVVSLPWTMETGEQETSVVLCPMQGLPVIEREQVGVVQRKRPKKRPSGNPVPENYRNTFATLLSVMKTRGITIEGQKCVHKKAWRKSFIDSMPEGTNLMTAETRFRRSVSWLQEKGAIREVGDGGHYAASAAVSEYEELYEMEREALGVELMNPDELFSQDATP